MTSGDPEQTRTEEISGTTANCLHRGWSCKVGDVGEKSCGVKKRLCGIKIGPQKYLMTMHEELLLKHLKKSQP